MIFLVTFAAEKSAKAIESARLPALVSAVNELMSDISFPELEPTPDPVSANTKDPIVACFVEGVPLTSWKMNLSFAESISAEAREDASNVMTAVADVKPLPANFVAICSSVIFLDSSCGAETSATANRSSGANILSA